MWVVALVGNKLKFFEHVQKVGQTGWSFGGLIVVGTGSEQSEQGRNSRIGFVWVGRRSCGSFHFFL